MANGTFQRCLRSLAEEEAGERGRSSGLVSGEEASADSRDGRTRRTYAVLYVETFTGLVYCVEIYSYIRNTGTTISVLKLFKRADSVFCAKSIGFRRNVGGGRNIT
ncbi:unnamed protein product [Pieris brassicae]|uniref:Uncharacterized protein n=1 Tax=Pieris brassicae TaxID=7116 RepID=A0A9P0TKZ8_PIEBR|nr:unnamed protein product [Pieris brassicae]